MPEKQKLQYISYLVFAYTENFVISPDIDHAILKNENLKTLSQETNGIPNMGIVPMGLWDLEDYHPISWQEIPNIMDSKYAIQ